MHLANEKPIKPILAQYWCFVRKVSNVMTNYWHFTENIFNQTQILYEYMLHIGNISNETLSISQIMTLH